MDIHVVNMDHVKMMVGKLKKRKIQITIPSTQIMVYQHEMRAANVEKVKLLRLLRLQSVKIFQIGQIRMDIHVVNMNHVKMMVGKLKKRKIQITIPSTQTMVYQHEMRAANVEKVKILLRLLTRLQVISIGFMENRTITIPQQLTKCVRRRGLWLSEMEKVKILLRLLT